MERPGKQTTERRGVCESALKLCTLWEGDQREAKVRTGLGKSHRPGSQGGLRKREPGGNEEPAAQPKGCPSETLRLPLRAPHFYPTSTFLLYIDTFAAVVVS
jgi:hypothetical protein